MHMYDKRLSYILFFILIFYVLGDTITTYYGLKLGHVEYNPFMNPIISVFGIEVIIFLKILFFIVLVRVTQHFIKINQKFAANCLNGTILIMGIFLTTSNTLVIFTGLNLFQHLGLM